MLRVLQKALSRAKFIIDFLIVLAYNEHKNPKIWTSKMQIDLHDLASFLDQDNSLKQRRGSCGKLTY